MPQGALAQYGIPIVAGWAGKQIFGQGDASPAASGILGEMQDAYQKQMAIYNQTNVGQQDATTLALARQTIDRQSQAALNEAQARFGDGGMPDSVKNQMQSSIAAQGSDQLANLASQLAGTQAQRQEGLLPKQPGYGAAALASGIDATGYRQGQLSGANWGVIGQGLQNAIKGTGTGTAGSSNFNPWNPLAGIPGLGNFDALNEANGGLIGGLSKGAQMAGAVGP